MAKTTMANIAVAHVIDNLVEHVDRFGVGTTGKPENMWIAALGDIRI